MFAVLSGPGSPLGSRDFRLLAGGVATNSFGLAMAPIALAFAVLELGGTATELGLVVAAFAAAEVVTVLAGGVLGDRLPRPLLLQGSSAACAVSQAVSAIALLTGHGSIALLTVVGVVNGCLGSLAAPASLATTPLTVAPEQLSDAIALRRLATQVTQVAGYAIGGVIVAAASPGWAIAVDATTYAIAAVFYSQLKVAGPAEPSGSSPLADFTAGAREVLRHTWLWLLIGQALLYHLFYGGVQGVLGPIVVSEQWDEAAWGWALAASWAGS